MKVTKDKNCCDCMEIGNRLEILEMKNEGLRADMKKVIDSVSPGVGDQIFNRIDNVIIKLLQKIEKWRYG